MEDSKDIANFYDAFAADYDATVLRDKDYTAFEKIPSWLIEALPPTPSANRKILDLGCGTGLGSLKFLEEHCDVTCVDISPKMIACAQKLPFKHLICQSLEVPLPFPNNQFDASILLGVMEFIKEPVNLFREVARVLKPGALFGLTIPKKLAPELEAELGIITYDPAKFENEMLPLYFTILKKEDFQGFIYKSTTVPYRGYLLQTSNS